MIETIGVRFKDVGKVYTFDPVDNQVAVGDQVIVETTRGVECGKVAIANRMVEDSTVQTELKPIIRKATPDDLIRIEENKRKADRAFDICEKKIAKHKLEMKLVSAEYTFDNKKILFFFTADGRVDFRELVKDLASVFKTRIELRQIGVRDEAKMIGGLGICGRPLCCSNHLCEFHPVSIKMAKQQGLSLNPTKISGTCGRLMCCLQYEEEAYEHLIRITPRVGALVDTKEGRGIVTEENLISGELKVKLDKNADDVAPVSFNRNQVKPVRQNRNRDQAMRKIEEN